MANTTELNTRVLTKLDNNASWIANDPVLLSGEVALVSITADSQSVILAKVGDGTHKFSQLDFISGLSADVFDWAKAELPDAELSSTSTNPVQNKVVNTAIASKQDKFANVTTPGLGKVAMSYPGKTYMCNYAESSGIYFDSSIRLLQGSGITNDDDLVNKKYVDDSKLCWSEF